MSKKLTIEEMHQLAQKFKGRCLSDTYINAHTKLVWECSEGHQWLTTPNKIQQGRWCPVCGIAKRGDAKRLSIEDMHELARKRGGKCISKTYVNSRTKLVWECKKEHRWEATPNNIQRGKWCPYCGGNITLTIEEMRQLAKDKGGKCLSNRYVNNETKLSWECAKGHRWEAIPNSIKRGSWCRKCEGLEKPSIEDIKIIATERGGICLSEKYKKARAKLLWECNEGHRWKATWEKIKFGNWCPECSAGLGERICREFFSQLFSNDFPKARPEWLLNNDGNQMELDGYCKPLRLAFEHQGEQHYSTKTHYITTEDNLVKRQKDDNLKKQLCDQHGIHLICIPEIFNRLPIGEVKLFIKRQCELKNIQLPNGFDSPKISLKKAYTTSHSKEILSDLRKIAIAKGGRCLSNFYVNDNTKLLWECVKGHQWESVPSSIKQGTWCPYCAGTIRKNIEEMNQLALRKGGKCLSTKYLGISEKLTWECVKGHKWESSPQHIVRGSWCPYCAGLGKTIEDMRNLARDRDGKCLSSTFLNAHTKLLWECAEGHKWKATPDSIRRGTWCPQCRGSKKHTIEEMHQLAKKQSGKCLSRVYLNNSSKLLWECDKGHQWEAIYSSIKRGSWCPVCRSTKHTIEDMHQLAKEYDGKCLSSQYVNLLTALLWECKSGHRWKAQPRRIKEGSWCRECRRKKRAEKYRTNMRE